MDGKIQGFRDPWMVGWIPGSILQRNPSKEDPQAVELESDPPCRLGGSEPFLFSQWSEEILRWIRFPVRCRDLTYTDYG
jgi:hypothetical protein